MPALDAMARDALLKCAMTARDMAVWNVMDKAISLGNAILAAKRRRNKNRSIEEEANSIDRLK